MEQNTYRLLRWLISVLLAILVIWAVFLAPFKTCKNCHGLAHVRIPLTKTGIECSWCDGSGKMTFWTYYTTHEKGQEAPSNPPTSTQSQAGPHKCLECNGTGWREVHGRDYSVKCVRCQGTGVAK